jgi:O-antigen/teichoic acid export membrane protein
MRQWKILTIRQPHKDLSASLTALLSWSRVNQAFFSISDQALSVGGMFLLNIALARTRSKEEYGMFALSYSVFTFLSGLHNSAILETYTVYGSGRYNQRYPEYARLLWRSNAWLALALTAVLLLAWLILSWAAPALASSSLLGMALASGVLFTASFVRQTFYVRRKPALAARLSTVFFLTVAVLLWVSVRAGVLSGFSAFLIAALGWMVAASSMPNELPGKATSENFLDLHPGYWPEHWKYARWVLATALVCQLTSQGYYWLVAGFLSLKDVAALRAMYILVGPVDQLFTALSFLVMPMMALRFASKQMGKLLSLWRTYLLVCVVVTSVFAVLVRIFGGAAIHLIYAGKFDDVSALLSTLALLPLVLGIGSTMNSALKSIEKPNLVLYGYLASGAVTVLGGIPLVIYFGLRGAVYGMLLSAAVYTATLGVGFVAYLHRPYRVQLATTTEIGLP